MNRRAFLSMVSAVIGALRVGVPKPATWDITSFEIYTAPIGTPFPPRDEAPQSPWVLGTRPKLFLAAPADADFL